MGHLEVGRLREQPAGEVLLADEGGTGAAARGNSELAALRGGNLLGTRRAGTGPVADQVKDMNPADDKAAQQQADIARELDFHLEMRVRELVAQGMSES